MAAQTRDREHRQQLLEITHIVQKGVWRGDSPHTIAQAVWDELHGRVIPDGREGMVTVYDCDGVYVGCMGVELWNALVNAREAIGG